ncbi:hypothetical protein VOLCADRAFT_101435, partial [Volvox carteri f. nagariensis]
MASGFGAAQSYWESLSARGPSGVTDDYLFKTLVSIGIFRCPHYVVVSSEDYNRGASERQRRPGRSAAGQRAEHRAAILPPGPRTPAGEARNPIQPREPDQAVKECPQKVQNAAVPLTCTSPDAAPVSLASVI